MQIFYEFVKYQQKKQKLTQHIKKNIIFAQY